MIFKGRVNDIPMVIIVSCIVAILALIIMVIDTKDINAKFVVKCEQLGGKPLWIRNSLICVKPDSLIEVQ